MAEDRRALILGVTGQDGAYLAAAMRRRGYTVAGLAQTEADNELQSWLANVRLLNGDLRDEVSISSALDAADPDIVVNLAGISSVSASWADPELVTAVNAVGVLTVLERIRRRQDKVGRQIRFLQASSAEIFGHPLEIPQRETTRLAPRNPYGVAKAFAHEMTAIYREAHGMHASTVVLFNHESPLRPDSFVTRKITKAAARIATRGGEALVLGNLDAGRDWGFAGDYVEAMVLALEQESPGDYVVASGELHSVREFAGRAFLQAGISDWEAWVRSDPALTRPLDAPVLIGDATKAREQLGWRPQVDFGDLVAGMVDFDLALAQGKRPTARLLPRLD